MGLTELYDNFLQCTGVSTDSRNVQAGQMYVALRGERFDGNAFALQALADGARFALVDDPQLSGQPGCLCVDDTLRTLQELAQYHRRQFNIPIIGLTGSNGKTTTKELIAAVLASHYRTHFTKGNFNNHIGVPLTLLAMPKGIEIAVIEMGANHQGEIAALSEIAEPTHGLITNVGMAHLEGFGGFEGVKKGKSELYRYLEANNGVAFINREEEHLPDLAASLKRKIFYKFSRQPSPQNPYYELLAHSLQPQINVSFLGEDGQLHKALSHLSGMHNLHNINTAITVGKYFKVPAAKIVEAIAGYIPSNNRTEWKPYKGLQLLMDAYNANPSSMEASLRNFAALDGQPKLAILGDMLELGDSSSSAHHTIAALAQSLPLQDVWLVGPRFQEAATQLGLRHFADVAALKSAFAPEDWAGGMVLLKGSRGMKLEELLS